MVTNVTNFGRSGLHDWLVQRLSALVLAAYTLFLLVFLLINPDLDHARWMELFQQRWVRGFTLLALVALIGHAWVGMWTISTDYLKPLLLRFLFQSGCSLVLFVYLVWGVRIVWSI
ncbi:MAG TPA: succinate dehydrogenase, hydrophobic membrane anchor protein [Pseudomonadales bacterium]|nr:succinate dehydrogenase, hydrophobic membrane anchor protein [Pseudomonadales bacterium]